jgi:cephalosporin hydroxylase
MKNLRLLVLVAVLSALATLFVVERVVRAPSGAERVVTEFFRLYHGRGIQRQTSWSGVQIQQTPTDMWMVQEIVAELKPDFLIETGTLRGGSALYYATVLQGLESAAKIITVDIEDQIDRALEFPVFRSRVIPIVGDSVGPDTIQRIADLVQDRPALVLLDSDHRKDHVLKELQLYSKFVPVGGYMIVFDTDLNGHPVTPEFGPGPMEAVEEFLRTDDRFVSDSRREKFLLTMCAKGYLKRIK